MVVFSRVWCQCSLVTATAAVMKSERVFLGKKSDVMMRLSDQLWLWKTKLDLNWFGSSTSSSTRFQLVEKGHRRNQRKRSESEMSA